MLNSTDFISNQFESKKFLGFFCCWVYVFAQCRILNSVQHVTIYLNVTRKTRIGRLSVAMHNITLGLYRDMLRRYDQQDHYQTSCQNDWYDVDCVLPY